VPRYRRVGAVRRAELTVRTPRRQFSHPASTEGSRCSYRQESQEEARTAQDHQFSYEGAGKRLLYEAFEGEPRCIGTRLTDRVSISRKTTKSQSSDYAHRTTPIVSHPISSRNRSAAGGGQGSPTLLSKRTSASWQHDFGNTTITGRADIQLLVTCHIQTTARSIPTIRLIVPSCHRDQSGGW